MLPERGEEDEEAKIPQKNPRLIYALARTFALGTARSPQNSKIDVPFPTARLSSVALRALSVDKELSPLVRRDFSTVVPPVDNSHTGAPGAKELEDECILRVHYQATTNRMLRVSVNSFMDSLALILEVMEKLDVDVLEAEAEAEAQRRHAE